MQQDALFSDPPARPAGRRDTVGAATPDATLVELAASLPAGLRLGTSSWTYPGWAGLVWDRDYPDAKLARHGLAAYARHPLMCAVGLDRSFYQPLTVGQYAAYAAQVPADFRFVVKAPSLVTDVVVRDESGRGRRPNPHFLDADAAYQGFVQPALEGFGHKLGALVFQISPLPGAWLDQVDGLVGRLHALLAAQPALNDVAPDAVMAVEVRDPQWLTPAFVQALRDTGATYCLGLHARMPSIAEQLPVLRALWPGPLVCRWNLNPLHGAHGYELARDLYAPFDRLVDPDLATRAALARVIAGTVGAGQRAYVTLSNKAEGSAPLSVRALAEAVHAAMQERGADRHAAAR